MQIAGITTVVTGAGSGMGEATARYLAQHGARVALLDLNVDAARKVADEIDGEAFACDVADAVSAEQAIEDAVSKFGMPRLLVNCAGIATGQRTVGRDGPMPLEDFKRVIDINLVGTFNMIRLAAAQMFELDPATDSGERGVIINTSSVAAFEGQIGQAAYSASKGGVVALTIQSAREFASKGIRVMTIAPGLIDTPMLQGMSDEVRESLSSQVPFPKRFGRPDEYASLVGHIIENEMLNGDVIRLDGAIRLQPR